jgi:hypothetical protein
MSNLDTATRLIEISISLLFCLGLFELYMKEWKERRKNKK